MYEYVSISVTAKPTAFIMENNNSYEGREPKKRLDAFERAFESFYGAYEFQTKQFVSNLFKISVN